MSHELSRDDNQKQIGVFVALLAALSVGRYILAIRHIGMVKANLWTTLESK